MSDAYSLQTGACCGDVTLRTGWMWTLQNTHATTAKQFNHCHQSTVIANSPQTVNYFVFNDSQYSMIHCCNVYFTRVYCSVYTEMQ